MTDVCVRTGTVALPSTHFYLGADGPYYFTPRKVVSIVQDVRALKARVAADPDADISAEAAERQNRWLARCIDEEEWKRIVARLNDPADALAQDHIDLLYDSMAGYVMNRMRGWSHHNGR